MTSHWLVIDQGGQSSRALLFDMRGQIVAAASRPVDTHREDAHVEHDAEELVDGITAALTELLAAPNVDPGTIAGAALATQRSSVVCWQADGQALSPVLSWQDRRAASALETMNLDAERLRQVTGLVPSPHYGASKLRWCLEHLPAVAAAQTRAELRLGPLSSFLLQRLVREQPFAVDPANASRTLLWDVNTADWSDWLLGAFGISRRLLPACVANRHTYGRLDAEPSIPLCACTGDQAAALFATGRPATGQVFINLGTGAFLQTLLAGETGASGLLESVVWQDAGQRLRVSEGTVNGAAGAVAAVARDLGIAMDQIERQVDAWFADQREPPVFVNGISGLGSPFWVADFASDFVGTGDARAKLVAVYESILFLLNANLRCLAKAGMAAEKITVTGGLANIDPLCQRLANLTGATVERPAIAEATARGMAWLVAAAAEPWPEPATQEFRPRADAPLQSRYQRWTRCMRERLDPSLARYLD